MVTADVGDADDSAERPMERFAGEEFFDRRLCRVAGVVATGVQVEVEHLLPHGRQVDEMALLAGVLLRDLDFHGLAGLLEAGEERRDGLAGLEIDGAFFGLDDDVGANLPSSGWKYVVGGAGAVGFGVAPVEMMVVDEGAVEDDAVMRREGAARVLAASAGVRP